MVISTFWFACLFIFSFVCVTDDRLSWLHVCCWAYAKCSASYWLQLWSLLKWIAIVVVQYFARESGCEVLWWICLSVCLSLCLYVCKDISGTTHTIFTKFFVHVAYVCGSVLLRHIGDRPHRLSTGKGDRSAQHWQSVIYDCLVYNVWYFGQNMKLLYVDVVKHIYFVVLIIDRCVTT